MAAKQKGKASRENLDVSAELMGTAKAAEELGVSQATLRRWLKEGRVQGVKVGKQWRFRRSDLGQVVDVQEAPAAPAPPPPDSDSIARCERQIDKLLKERGIGKAELDKELTRLDRDTARSVPESDPDARRILLKLLINAVHFQVSDLHIEPMAESLKIRQRIDGLLMEVVDMPKGVARAFVDEVKRWSKLDVNERRRTQDGRICLETGGRVVDARISTMPSIHGEVVTLRILDRQAVALDLARLGFEPDQLERYQRLIHSPNRSILVTGPAGCGKTTTVYASLVALNTADRKIMTAEDPVEYDIGGIIQTPVNETVGMGFSRIAVGMLRQAPNIMFVGEVRDRETAEIVLQAGLTGHLVFSALHTQDTIAAITRLLALGVRPFLVSSGLRGIVGQRLVRLICPHCKAPYQESPEWLDTLQLTGADRKRTFYYGKGCKQCALLGYRGRVAVYEVLELTRDVAEAAMTGGRNTIIEAARASGWRPLREVALDKLFRGETTFEELVRGTCIGDEGL